MDAKKLGAFIAQLRKEQNMTQAELAKKLQVTDKAVSKWKRGKLSGFIFGFIGGILLFIGTYFKITSASVSVIGGVDGPTAIFLAGNLPSSFNIMVAFGILCIIICLLKLFRKKR